jgi:hypothetical protein
MVEQRDAGCGIGDNFCLSPVRFRTSIEPFAEPGLAQTIDYTVNLEGIKMKRLFYLLPIFLFCGCNTTPLAGGHARISTPGFSSEVKQSENPAAQTTQVVEETVTTETPATSSATNCQKVITIRKVQTTIGAAQKDIAREIGAKLSNYRMFQWFGLALFLFGVGTMFYPPLKILVGGSSTTSMAISAAGLGIFILPMLIVGHEVLILCGLAGAAGVWFLAHRHGQLRGRLDADHEQLDNRADDFLKKIKLAATEKEVNDLVAEADRLPGVGPAVEAAGNQRKIELHKP